MTNPTPLNQQRKDPTVTTTLLTEHDVAEAENAARVAVDARRAAEHAYATRPASMSNYETLEQANITAAQAEERARVLRAVFNNQQADRDQRADRLRDIVKALAPTSKRLAKSRDTAVQAVAEAEQAIARALAVVAEHDRLVHDTAAELKAGGWRTENGESTGTDISGALLLGGERWSPVDGPSLLAMVLTARVAAAVPRHPLGRQTWMLSGGHRDGRADFLGRLAKAASARSVA